MFTTDLVNLYNRNIFKTSLYIYIFQDEKMSSYAQSIFIYGYKDKKIRVCDKDSFFFVLVSLKILAILAKIKRELKGLKKRYNLEQSFFRSEKLSFWADL